MFIDIPYFIFILFAIYKGYSRGLIVAIFSFLAIVIGLAAAIKLSSIVANWLTLHTHLSSGWLPVISFVIVLIGVIALVRLLAGILQKSVEFMLMGWLNKFGGILLYTALYTMVFSTLLFYAIQLRVLKSDAIDQSKCYFFVKPWASFFINGIGTIFPIFKDMFSQLESFFDASSKRFS